MTNDKLGKCSEDDNCLTFWKRNTWCRLMRKHWAWSVGRNIVGNIVGNSIMRLW